MLHFTVTGMDVTTSTQQTLTRLEQQHMDRLGTMATPQKALNVLFEAVKSVAAFRCIVTGTDMIISILQMLMRLA